MDNIDAARSLRSLGFSVDATLEIIRSTRHIKAKAVSSGVRSKVVVNEDNIEQRLEALDREIEAARLKAKEVEDGLDAEIRNERHRPAVARRYDGDTVSKRYAQPSSWADEFLERH